MGSISFTEKGLSFVYACFKEYGGQTYFIGYFLVGLLYVLFHGTRRERYFFCGVTAFLTLTIYNPLLANPVIQIMHMTAEYYRFFWILPISILLAWICVNLFDEQKEKWKKIGLVCFFSFLLLFSGNPAISELSSLQIPQNKYKVPDELIAACEIIHQDSVDNEYPKSVFEYEYNTLVRQYDGFMKLTLDRDVYLVSLGSNTVSPRNLSEEEIDNQNLIIDVIQNQNLSISPVDLASALQATETDYLVISKSSENVLSYLTSAGCVSFADTGDHIIFRYEWQGGAA